MSSPALFGISIAFSFIAWGILLGRYIWPELRRQSRADASRPILLLRGPRHTTPHPSPRHPPGGQGCVAQAWRVPRVTQT
jgi:hypothetical protein